MLYSQLISVANKGWNHLTATEKDKYEREALYANSDYGNG
jgi:hypothetical protein